jgi:hypothetical protein
VNVTFAQSLDSEVKKVRIIYKQTKPAKEAVDKCLCEKNALKP